MKEDSQDKEVNQEPGVNPELDCQEVKAHVENLVNQDLGVNRVQLGLLDKLDLLANQV